MKYKGSWVKHLNELFKIGQSYEFIYHRTIEINGNEYEVKDNNGKYLRSNKGVILQCHIDKYFETIYERRRRIINEV